MYEAELLGGPLHYKTYAVSSYHFLPTLKFLERVPKYNMLGDADINEVTYRRFLANLYIYEKSEKREDLDSHSHI